MSHTRPILPVPAVLACVIALLATLLLAPVTVQAYGDGGNEGDDVFSKLTKSDPDDDDDGDQDDDQGGGQVDVVDQQPNPPTPNPPPKPPKPFVPIQPTVLPDPPQEFVFIELDPPIQLEPLDIGTMEPVELVDFGGGIGGHPGWGIDELGNFHLVTYVDVIAIYYNPNMGWVGETTTGRVVSMPPSPLVNQVINAVMSGK